MLDLAEQTEVVTRKGAWYSYNEDKISQGRDNAVKYLEQNLELAGEIEKKVREKLEMGAVVSANSVTPIESEEEEMEMEMEMEMVPESE